MTPLKGALSLLNLSYVKRWVVAPTFREQSVAEHTFRVAIIAQSLAMGFHPDAGWTEARVAALMLMVLQHDADELTTGDVPGPAKSKVAGYLRPLHEVSPAECMVKVADSIETATFWLQWGNSPAWKHEYNNAPWRDVEKIHHYAAKIPGLLDAAKSVWFEITGEYMPEYPAAGEGGGK